MADPRLLAEQLGDAVEDRRAVAALSLMSRRLSV
jgi:hypothetical protein